MSHGSARVSIYKHAGRIFAKLEPVSAAAVLIASPGLAFRAVLSFVICSSALLSIGFFMASCEKSWAAMMLETKSKVPCSPANSGNFRDQALALIDRHEVRSAFALRSKCDRQ